MTRRNWAFDVAIAATVVLLGQLEVWSGIEATHRQGPRAAEAAVYAITGALLVLRRVAPLESLAAATAVLAVEFALVGAPEGAGLEYPGVLLGYAVGRWEARRPAWWGLPLLALMGIAWDGLDPQNTTVAQHLQGFFWVSHWIIAWFVGALVRSRAVALQQRRLAREQREAQTVAEERNRIARELHDVIGHSVSVMTVQASAVRRRLRPEQDVEREALETVESAGREALAEMRRMVSVLRDGTGETDLEPPPGLAQLDRLVDEFLRTGLPVTLERCGAVRTLAGGIDLTAYRLVQEGLTNTLRHAVRPSAVQVRLDYGRDRLDLAVRDDGAAVPADVEPGHGLLGMRERVAVYGGTLVARPLPDHGFELLATLPLEPS